MKILLINDDGLDSPALLPTITELEKIGEVTSVIPRYQQSWTSKSQSRRRQNIKKEIHVLRDKTIITLDGQPADCTNFGLFNLNKEFDIVVSGANVGHNVGLHAFFSSGTVGAALEGLITGFPAVSISVPYARGDKLISREFTKSLNDISRLIKAFYQSKTNFQLMSLNIPYNKINKKLIATTIHKFSFKQLFYEDESGLIQPVDYPNLYYPSRDKLKEGTDTWARAQSFVSVVMLDNMAQFVEHTKVQDWLGENNLERLGNSND